MGRGRVDLQGGGVRAAGGGINSKGWGQPQPMAPPLQGLGSNRGFTPQKKGFHLKTTLVGPEGGVGVSLSPGGVTPGVGGVTWFLPSSQLWYLLSPLSVGVSQGGCQWVG